jgi:hypothetical protein
MGRRWGLLVSEYGLLTSLAPSFSSMTCLAYSFLCRCRLMYSYMPPRPFLRRRNLCTAILLKTELFPVTSLPSGCNRRHTTCVTPPLLPTGRTAAGTGGCLQAARSCPPRRSCSLVSCGILPGGVHRRHRHCRHHTPPPPPLSPPPPRKGLLMCTTPQWLWNPGRIPPPPPPVADGGAPLAAAAALARSASSDHWDHK